MLTSSLLQGLIRSDGSGLATFNVQYQCISIRLWPEEVVDAEVEQTTCYGIRCRVGPFRIFVSEKVRPMLAVLKIVILVIVVSWPLMNCPDLTWVAKSAFTTRQCQDVHFRLCRICQKILCYGISMAMTSGFRKERKTVSRSRNTRMSGFESQTSSCNQRNWFVPLTKCYHIQVCRYRDNTMTLRFCSGWRCHNARTLSGRPSNLVVTTVFITARTGTCTVSTLSSATPG